MKKYFIISFILIIVITTVIFLKFNSSLDLYSKDYFYMDTVINVKFYHNNKKEANDILNNIDSIYSRYHMLTDRYNGYDDINNIYYINNNKSTDKYISLDSDLYDLINYAIKFDDDLFDINMGGVIDVWKRYRDSGKGIPSSDELKRANKRNSITLATDNRILNNHPNIDLGGISKGYTTQIVAEFLESMGIRYYLINAGGNVKAGDSYNKDFYSIGIQSPDKDGISYVLKSKNVSVVTSGGYERNYVYDGVMYHHIISPKTLFPTNYMKSVTVVTTDSALGDYLSTTLFLMDVDSGLEFIKKFDAEALWILNDSSIIKSEGFSRYEQE